MFSKTASLMKWHVEEHRDDGTFRHPADSQAWKEFDKQNPSFASDVRNVRLGLAADGFNPYGRMSVAHSTWPVVHIVYNLPPWLCMKQCFLFLSMLIDGPKGPGNKIDVYLQPLIEELKELFSIGLQTYDASTGEMFSLKAALLWTISDFPAYAMLSGWSTRVGKACPGCAGDTKSCWMKHGRKFFYIGHRRFLHKSDRMRKDKISFDGKMEWGEAPKLLSVMEMLQQLDGVLTEYKKENLKKRRTELFDHDKHQFWKEKGISFELPYWATNLVPHNLDIMHIEGNCCDSLLSTIMGLVGKSKDNLNSRRDLEELGIRKPLHPIRKGSSLVLPPSSFT
ncbi:hypothetical protein ACH5RR_018247 [Cinchona calisaya]|uniref:Transposase n=1 Tax=Cinchona calisaya TaxID=153742 RepID=A0ABD2ZR04_9GENT